MAALTAAGPGSAAYYFNDFEASSTTGFSGFVSVQGTQGYSNISGFTGFGAKFLRNDTAGDPGVSTVLTLTGLPTHTGINLGFLLAIIDSWDSVGCCAPDYFTVKVDGVAVFNETFDNFNGGAGQSYGTAPIGGVRAPRGFNSGFSDAAYDLTSLASLQNIAHTGSTLTLDFHAEDPGGNSFQGGSDESWAIDNLSIDLLGVSATAPEPATVALIGVGLVAFGVLRQRLTRR